MHTVGPRCVDGVSGRVYRELAGDKFWFWPKRGFYVSQKGGKQRMLHRVAFGDISREVVPADGDWENFDPTNWIGREKGADRQHVAKHECQVFNGTRYYRLPDRGYFARRVPGMRYMHRDVWEHHHGPIPDGYHVHHVNEDKGDNRVENLQLLRAFDHLSHHAKHSEWVGSEQNKRQLREAGKLARSGRKTRVGHCDECEAAFETVAINRRFCGKGCRYKADYRRSASL